MILIVLLLVVIKNDKNKKELPEVLRNQNSVEAIATRYGFVTVRCLSPVWGKGYSKSSTELRGPPSLLFSVHQGTFPGGKAAG